MRLIGSLTRVLFLAAVFAAVVLVGIVLIAAIFANAVNLKCMPGRQVVVPAADFLFDVAHFRRKKLHRAAALGADHVVVAAAIVLVLVPRDAVVKGDLAGQAALGEQLQCAIHRGVADARVFFLHQPVELVRRKVVTGLKKGSQNRVPLRSLFQADIFEMAMQNPLRLTNHLA